VVIGAGVSGLTTAVCLAEAGMTVRVDAERLPAETTSAAAGALWDPYLAEPRDLVERWSREPLAVLIELSADADTGIRRVEGAQESRIPCDLPSRGADELRPGFVAGWRYTALLVDMPRYLAYLVRRLEQAGGILRQHRCTTVDEAAGEAPVVVNCSGAEARFLAVDPSIDALRGRLGVVENPGIRSSYPHSDVVVLGSTAARGCWERTPDESAAREIIRRCATVEPSLAGARALDQRVGLRPVRGRVRFMADQCEDTLLVHNYGHGGAGPTLSWGCAREVAERVRTTVGLPSSTT
jgi:D-amino-acid oxidase